MNPHASNCGRMSEVTVFDYDESLLMMACKEHPDALHELGAATCARDQNGADFGKPFTPPPWGWRKSACAGSREGLCACGTCVASEGGGFTLSPSVFSHCGAAGGFSQNDGDAGGRSWAPDQGASDSGSPVGEDQFDAFGPGSKEARLSGDGTGCGTGVGGAPAPASRAGGVSAMLRKAKFGAPLSQGRGPMEM